MVSVISFSMMIWPLYFGSHIVCQLVTVSATLSRRTPMPVVPHWYGTLYLWPSVSGSYAGFWNLGSTFLKLGISDMSSGVTRPAMISTWTM